MPSIRVRSTPGNAKEVALNIKGWLVLIALLGARWRLYICDCLESFEILLDLLVAESKLGLITLVERQCLS